MSPTENVEAARRAFRAREAASKAHVHLVKPIVNLNGTSRESLLEGYTTAMTMIERAIGALQQIAPHGRDYFSDEALARATQQHRARIERLETIRLEIEHVAENF